MTYYLRTERFSVGSWAKSIDDKIFFCLERLQCLIEYEKILKISKKWLRIKYKVVWSFYKNKK
ncbi:hypothetical protein [Clostridium thermobutyricum]|uniref:Uncharacterized protein n=1 Tax=Clostridium thermobutyricum DSM 4928 TaxID=1121339 RepID=A0A1V4SU00_9CLOT|nr:hypothetical protein [Clostridium thermobutyricum]OPX47366.1 hypothetical protein CLTHE_19290 [Clostridium thermobutyricum DSM 4928]